VEGGQYLQITAPISSKSSGGALFDRDGQLMGLTTFYRAKKQNLRFAVPVEWIRELPGRHKTNAEQPTH
jgi:S1-C subfamily serine protease